jgi:hypothetical protein
MSTIPEGPIITPHHDAIEHARHMAYQAEMTDGAARCSTGEAVFFFEYPIPLIPGHIYSEKGVDEFRISKTCEYHFDSDFAPEDAPCREVMGGRPVWS